MECEMCGSKVGTRRYRVDGSVMRLGACCGKYGELIDAPASAGPAGSAGAVEQGLRRRAARTTGRSVYDGDDMDLVEDFGKRIRLAREKKGISKEILGGKVAARVPQLNQIEAGSLRPSERLAKALERELGITLMEKVDVPSGVSGAPKKASGKGLTIGDLLKEQLDS